MSNNRVRVAIAVLLIGAGILTLLQNLRILAGGLELFWSLCFLAAGGVFTYIFVVDRKNWWAVIPGFALLGIGLLILLGWALPIAGARWGGAIFLGSLGASFWVIYANQRDHWWPVIPGGVLITLALVSALDEGVRTGFDTGAIFFLGLAATFYLIYVLSSSGGKMRWALYPAGILGAIGVIIALSTSSAIRFVFPAVLIVAGAFLVIRAATRRQAGGG